MRRATRDLQKRKGNSLWMLDLAINVPDPLQRGFRCSAWRTDIYSLCKVPTSWKSTFWPSRLIPVQLKTKAWKCEHRRDRFDSVVCVSFTGACSYKDQHYKAGDSFRRGCDKCFCHELGFYCFAWVDFSVQFRLSHWFIKMNVASWKQLSSALLLHRPMKPTSWPRKCRRIRTECGYSVVYKENPLVECRAYSWIGWHIGRSDTRTASNTWIM